MSFGITVGTWQHSVGCTLIIIRENPCDADERQKIRGQKCRRVVWSGQQQKFITRSYR